MGFQDFSLTVHPVFSLLPWNACPYERLWVHLTQILLRASIPLLLTAFHLPILFPPREKEICLFFLCFVLILGDRDSCSPEWSSSCYILRDDIEFLTLFFLVAEIVDMYHTVPALRCFSDKQNILKVSINQAIGGLATNYDQRINQNSYIFGLVVPY